MKIIVTLLLVLVCANNALASLDIDSFYPFQIGMSLEKVKIDVEQTGGKLSENFVADWSVLGALNKTIVFYFDNNKLNKMSRIEINGGFDLLYDYIENLTTKYGKPDLSLKTVVTAQGRNRVLKAEWCIQNQKLTVVGPSAILWQLELGCRSK